MLKEKHFDTILNTEMVHDGAVKDPSEKAFQKFLDSCHVGISASLAKESILKGVNSILI